MNKTILVAVAHSDDQILGPGGTLAKLAKEGFEIYTVIFSFGESSHFWLKRKITVEMRVEESRKADKVIGGSGVFFLGLKEGKFIQETNEKNIKSRLKRLIKNKNPSVIFTHSVDDPHPDHIAVYKIINEVVDSTKSKIEMYSFDVWNPFNFRFRNKPKLYIDVSKTFKIKNEAIQKFKSQRISLISLVWSVYLRAIIHGLTIEKKYAERFYRIR